MVRPGERAILGGTRGAGARRRRTPCPQLGQDRHGLAVGRRHRPRNPARTAPRCRNPTALGDAVPTQQVAGRPGRTRSRRGPRCPGARAGGRRTGTEGEPDQEPAVVVGVDGSQAMHDVLSFAFDYASRHHRPVHAVFCYRRDLLTTSPRRFRQPSAEQADRWLGEVTAGWQEKYPDVRLERVVIREHPVSALVTQSQGQDLFVVSSHAGRGRLASALGSVSQGVLHHARCPVAIVPLADTG